ncbi:hypothetical protein BSQ39_07750 [Loigolactobacillus backii]|nr:hypothetical protein BSQ39_07750 [Loigolactobacillus backii]
MTLLRKKNWLIGLFLLIGLFVVVQPAAANELTFGVQANLPDNQVDRTVNYFDLKLNPGQKQQISVTVNNSTAKEVKIRPTVSQATTNLNGVVEYNKGIAKSDKTLKYKIADYVQPTEKTLTLAPHETKQLKLNVTMPNRAFRGVIAGGLRLQDQNQLDAQKKQKKGTTVQNQYAYLLGIVLQQSTKKITPQLKLGKVTATQTNYRNVITSELRNVSAMYINKFSVNAKVLQNGKKIYQQKSTNLQLAPNSVFSYPLRLNGERLKAGTYQMDIIAKSKGHTWHFKKQFTISGKTADKLNKRDVSIKPDHTLLYTLIGFGILLILGGLIWFIMHRKSRKMREENQRLKDELAQKK